MSFLNYGDERVNKNKILQMLKSHRKNGSMFMVDDRFSTDCISNNDIDEIIEVLEKNMIEEE